MKNKNFAVFILTYGRPDRVQTYYAIRKQGYTGAVYLICSDDDKTLPEYQSRFGKDVIVFSKDAYAKTFDIGDNFEGQNVVVFARNAAFDIAKKLGLKYFLELDDDYACIRLRIPTNNRLRSSLPSDLDGVFDVYTEFLRTTDTHCIAMAQAGDFIGGKDNDFYHQKYVGKKRKIMNSFFNAADKPYQFFGRINEDVNCYIENGKRGYVFVTHPIGCIYQMMTQQNVGGLTDFYLSAGTYVKSFYTVLYNPSAVTVAKMGETFKRYHHRIKWRHAVPYIIEAKYKKLDKQPVNSHESKTT